MSSTNRVLPVAAALLLLFATAPRARGDGVVSFSDSDGSLQIAVDGRPLATYVYRDPKILRPYLAHVRAGETQVTRNHPPLEGTDATDHDTMHPGIWLAFGDISGADFWRNKARVEHVAFVEPPRSDAGGGHFTVRNRYLADGKTLSEELCRITIRKRAGGTLIVWDSRFSGSQPFTFGDQEEMGLGVRLATPLAVKNGGRLVNAEGLDGEKQVWGKPSAWCDYSGTIDGKPLGILLVPDTKNFRPAWFHARDYGFVAANPFGRHAFTGGEKSQVTVSPGETLRLRYGVLLHAGPIELDAAARDTAGVLDATR